MKMKVQYFSSYSSVLLLLLSCYSSVLFLRVCMLELDDKASYSFPVFPSPSFSFFFFCTFISPLFTWIVETWKCRRRSCAPLVTGRRKLCTSGYCVVTQFEKSSLELLLLPLRCKHSNQWGPWTVNPVFFFTKQFKSTVYLKRSRNRVNKRTRKGGGGRRAGAAEGDSVTAWTDRVWLKVELVLLLHM